MNQYMIERLARKNGILAPLPTKKPPKEIPKKSAKRIESDKALAKITKRRLKENPFCTINSPVCQHKARAMDHIQKTSPKNRLVEENLTGSCHACNRYKETHPKWAEANGKAISRFAKLEEVGLAIHDQVEGNRITIVDKIKNK